ERHRSGRRTRAPSQIQGELRTPYRFVDPGDQITVTFQHSQIHSIRDVVALRQRQRRPFGLAAFLSHRLSRSLEVTHQRARLIDSNPESQPEQRLQRIGPSQPLRCGDKPEDTALGGFLLRPAAHESATGTPRLQRTGQAESHHSHARPSSRVATTSPRAETSSSKATFDPRSSRLAVSEPTRVIQDATGFSPYARWISSASSRSASHACFTRPTCSVSRTGSSNAPTRLIDCRSRTMTTTASGSVRLANEFCLPVGIDRTNDRTNASTARRVAVASPRLSCNLFTSTEIGRAHV